MRSQVFSKVFLKLLPMPCNAKALDDGSRNFQNAPPGSLSFPVVQLNKALNAPKTSGFMALALSLLLCNAAQAKSLQIDGVHYQPEGLVIQVMGGKLSAPKIETFPNEKDGVKSELIMVRMPNCEANYSAIQQAALKEIGTHPEVKQFWITPLDADKKTGQGLQVVLEVELGPDKPEFTPEVMEQGNDQWVITLQSVASKLTNHPIQPASEKSALEQAPEPASGSPSDASHTARNKRQTHTNEPQNAQQAETAQNLLTALTQAKQRQAELGTQIVALQQALAESEAQKEALQSRVNGYENLLEEAGVNPRDEQSEDRVVINNLKSALVKVVQKLKATEEALAKANAKSSARTSPPVRNLVDHNVPPIATLGLLEDEQTVKAPPQRIAFSPQVPSLAPLSSITSKTNSSIGPAKPAAKVTLAISPNKTTPAKAGTSGAVTNVYQVSATGLKKDDTEARLQNAISKNPVLVDNYLALADYYIAQKDWPKAQGTLINLTHVEPGGAQGYYYLAMIYLCQKDQHSAQVALWRYAHRNPRDRQGILALKRALQANNSATPNAKASVASKSKEPSLDLGH